MRSIAKNRKAEYQSAQASALANIDFAWGHPFGEWYVNQLFKGYTSASQWPHISLTERLCIELPENTL